MGEGGELQIVSNKYMTNGHVCCWLIMNSLTVTEQYTSQIEHCTKHGINKKTGIEIY